MSAKTVFISSTYMDLKDYRREVWDALRRFDVIVRGMEEFGARTTGPLETCLAEVEQSDVYVDIIAYRLGSLDPETKKPFTLLEYEKAVEQKKEVLIYLAEDAAASFPRSMMDDDTRARKRLAAFKSRLRERHTVETFSTPEDLTEKLSRDFRQHFLLKQPEQSDVEPADLFAKSARVLKEFRLTPKRYNGQEIRLTVSFYHHDVFPASRKLCEVFNLEYGFTVGAYMSIKKPEDQDSTSGFHEIFATGNKVDGLRALVQGKKAELYAQLQFTSEDVENVRGEFLGSRYYEHDDPGDPSEVYRPPEGKIILLFTKPA